MPQITVKSLQKETFTLNYEPSDTIASLKTKINESHNHPIDHQHLIFNGKVLPDTSTMASLNFQEKDFLVLMIRKPKAAAPTPAPSTSTPTTTSSTSPAPTTTSAPTTSVPSTTATTTSAPSTSTPSTPSTPSTQPITVTADPNIVANLMEMGFVKDQVELALQLSMNNAEQAVQFLSEYPTGIPQQVVNQVNQMRQQMASPQAQTSPFNQGSSQPSTSSPQTGSSGASSRGGSVFDPLRQLPQFSHLRYMVQQQPELLEPILSSLGRQNPQLLQLVNDHQEEFLELLKEPIDPSHLASMPTGGNFGQQQPNVIQVSQEEKEAIDRLENLVSGMGISRSKVIEAYFSCDKNEELAANFLLENPQFEDDD